LDVKLRGSIAANTTIFEAAGLSRPKPTKQDVIDEIVACLGLKRVQVSNGSTEPKQLFVDVARVLDVTVLPEETKQQLAERIAVHLKQPWDAGCDSRHHPRSGGGTVTLEGLQRILAGLASLPTCNDANLRARAAACGDLLDQNWRNFGSLSPDRVRSVSDVFVRDPKVVAVVNRMAAGKCESCGRHAPFEDDNGQPFLEVHHVVPLAEGGVDTVENAVAVCPNCHRAAHHARNRLEIQSRLQAHVRIRVYPR
jgi:5-methylcytosine-specific restriction endonuclease McrA